jgi:glycosyl transferase, family 25
MLLNDIPKLVINLPQRTDRLELFKQELIHINSHVQIINGIEHQNPMVGIGQAHINCILIAKQNEWDNVIIMEDDCIFQGKEKTLEYINNCLLNAPNDWDILLGGVYYSKKRSPFNDYWERIGEFCGLHFYIVNSKAYDKILEYDFTQHIDRWLNHNNRLNCFVAKKFFATQRDGFSDNTKKKEDYSRLLKKYELL